MATTQKQLTFVKNVKNVTREKVRHFFKIFCNISLIFEIEIKHGLKKNDKFEMESNFKF